METDGSRHEGVAFYSFSFFKGEGGFAFEGGA